MGEEGAEGCCGVFGRGVEELDRVAGADGVDEGGPASGGFFEPGGGFVGCDDVVGLGRGVFIWRFWPWENFSLLISFLFTGFTTRYNV